MWRALCLPPRQQGKNEQRHDDDEFTAEGEETYALLGIEGDDAALV
jgi:hypothetical protein